MIGAPPHRPAPPAPRTLLDALAGQLRPGGGRGIRLLDDRGRASYCAYSELLVEAAAAGRALDRAGLRRGDRLLILLPTCRTLVTTLLGCLGRGILPCPVDPGPGWSRWEDGPPEALAAARRLAVRGIVVAARRVASLARLHEPGDPLVLPAEGLRSAPAIGSEEPRLAVGPADPAMLLDAAPGEPGEPVLLTHGGLVAHLTAVGRALRVSEREVLCTLGRLDGWLGLVDGLLLGLFCGFDQVLLSREWADGQPGRWLDALAAFRCTLVLAEESAYGLAAHRLPAEALEPARDLSSLRRAIAVSRTVRPGTLQAFSRRFREQGLPPDLFLPAYGLAAAAGIFTLGRPGAAPLADRFDRRSLAPGGFVHTAGAADSRGRLMLSSGEPLPGQELGIFDPQGRRRGEGIVGRICGRGRAFAPAAEPEGWHDTGDLGFVMEGELFVVGRRGEELDLGGLRYEPAELEAIATEVPGIRGRGAAAFALGGETGSQPVLVVAPDGKTGRQQRGLLADRLGRRVGRTIGVRPQVVLVPGALLPAVRRGQVHREEVRARLFAEPAPGDGEGAQSPPALPGEPGRGSEGG